MIQSIVALFLLAAPVAEHALAPDLRLPEDFFMGMPQPNDTVQFVYTCPSSLDPQTIEREAGWWNACAKLGVLMNQNLDFRAGYLAATKDADLSNTGITFSEWSRSSQARKEELRVQLVKVIQGIAGKYDLERQLTTIPVDARLIAERRAKNEAKLADQLGITGQTTGRLFEFCPGAADNVSVISQHPAFDRFKELMNQPAAAEAYRATVREFGAYLDAHPASSVAEKNAELARLLAPILQDMH